MKNIIIAITASLIALLSVYFITGCSVKKVETTETAVAETTVIETTSVPSTTEMPKIEIKHEEYEQ
ncbi:MAG: hypothetical protein J1E85_06995 [Ruminococcus sp.]|nr:hypothetical protein [Ruminococcus sp.]